MSLTIQPIGFFDERTVAANAKSPECALRSHDKQPIMVGLFADRRNVTAQDADRGSHFFGGSKLLSHKNKRSEGLSSEPLNIRLAHVDRQVVDISLPGIVDGISDSLKSNVNHKESLPHKRVNKPHPSRDISKDFPLHGERHPHKIFGGMHASSDKRQQARIEVAEDEVQRG